MNNETENVIVVGSGSIGKSTAHYLAQEKNERVLVVGDPEPLVLRAMPKMDMPFVPLNQSKYRKGGNNRKGHKRKKAFNGRRKRK